MCQNVLSGTTGALIDPGGFIAEKANTAIVPQGVQPIVQAFSGVQGTATALKDKQRKEQRESDAYYADVNKAQQPSNLLSAAAPTTTPATTATTATTNSLQIETPAERARRLSAQSASALDYDSLLANNQGKL